MVEGQINNLIIKKYMENNMDKKVCGCGGGMGGGNCGGMGMHGCHGGKYHLMKVILKLVILIIVFWCGLKLGEMTGFVRAEYGRGTMTRSDFGMMRGGNSDYGYANLPMMNVSPAVPATPAK